MKSIPIEEMCFNMYEALIDDFEKEDQGSFCMPLFLCKGLYWAAQILMYVNQNPAAKSMVFPYGDDDEQTIDIEASEAVNWCVWKILNDVKISDSFADGDDSRMFRFCRNEILSGFPGIYSIDKEIDNNLYASIIADEMQELIGQQYPIELLRTIISIIEYINMYISPNAAEELLANYLRRWYLMYKNEKARFSEVCGLTIGHFAQTLRSEFLIEIYELYISYIDKSYCLFEYSDILYVAAITFAENDIDKALSMLYEALHIRIDAVGGHHLAVSATYAMISLCNYMKKNFRAAISNAICAYEACPNEEQTVFLGTCLTHLVSSYHTLGEYEDIPKWLKIISSIY